MACQPVREVAAGVYRIDVNHPQPQTTCCYLITEGDAAALIDCGGGQRGAQAVMAGLQTLGVAAEQIKYLLATHAHLDHAGAAGILMQALPQAVFAAHPSAVKHLTQPFEALVPASLALYGERFFQTCYGGMQAVPAERARALADNEEITLNGRALTALHTPGHAWHHASFYDAKASFIAAGDACGISYRRLYNGEPGLLAPVTPPSQYNPPAMINSIRRLFDGRAALIGLAHYDVIDAAARGEEYQRMLLDALEEWNRHAEELYRRDRAKFEPAMKKYLTEWMSARAAARGADRDEAAAMHANDAALSAGGFLYYLNKTAAA